MIARVAVTLALDKEFEYSVPAELESSVVMGSRVLVPFGRRRIEGYVVGIPDAASFPNLKPVAKVLGGTPFLDAQMLRLVRWMAEYYCAPLELCIRTVLPSAVRNSAKGFKTRLWVSLVAESEDGGDAPATSSHQAVVVRRCTASAPPAPAPLDARDGMSQSVVQQGTTTQHRALSEKQQLALDVLVEHDGGMWLQELLRAARITAAPVKALERKGLVGCEARDQKRDPLEGHTVLPTEPLPLMAEQAVALNAVQSSIATLDPPVVLLYGVTGSGKTEVYLQAIAGVLENEGGAIVLVPEISLTPQTVSRFQSRFGDRIAVLHSHLSDGERHDEWHRIHSGEARVVVGARSAVFAPVHNLKLIVVDEEHEPSYKQSDAPRYSARDVAVMRGSMLRCSVVLGSATPSLESWNNVLIGKYGKAVLAQRVDDRSMPAMRIIDMRIEAERNGFPSVFSRDLIEAISARLQRSEQTILFLNRRGYSSSLICSKCGYVSECEWCSVSRTYHQTDNTIRCHLCGRRASVPDCCPACQDPAFKYVGAGTQRVETVARKFFPQANIQRMDADTTTRRDSYERILGDVRRGRIDILIGTQMIAKGLHFPNVTLVGVVNADLSLHLPDFRAGERTFQLLAQVAGRAGRGDISGEVLVQTYTPHHEAVQAARRLDYEGFCAMEVEFRKELLYPPSAHLIAILFKGKAEAQVRASAESLARKIREQVPASVFVSEACPAPLARIKGDYRYQLLIRTVSVKRVTQPLKAIMDETRFPRGISCQLDVDALNLM